MGDMAFFARFNLTALTLILAVAPAMAQERPESTGRAGTASALVAPWSDCLPSPGATGPGLRRFWERVEAVDPTFRHFGELTEAERATGAAIRREWLPLASLQGVGDYGQRLSPGEERVLGVGARGELRILAQWRLLDGDRGARAASSNHREGVVQAEEAVFRADVRAELARLYLEVVTAGKRVELRERQVERLENLGRRVEERARAGFESTWEEGLLDEGRTRAGRRLLEAHRDLDMAETEMALRMDGCDAMSEAAPEAEPSHPDGAAGSGASTRTQETEPAPEVVLGFRRAEALEFLAREEAHRDRWSLDVLGILGPNRSRAFDDGFVRNEYLVGLALSWRPDLAGIRGRLAEADQARARAERSWAQGIQAEVERELTRLELDQEHRAEVGRRLQAELDAAADRLDGALLRWTEGVDRWIDVLQAADRLTDLEVEVLEHHLAVADLIIRRHRLTGAMDLLPDALALHSSTWSQVAP